MNILVTIDKNYISPLVTMLISMGEADKENPMDIYVAHSNLTDDEIKKITDVARAYENMKIHSLKVENSVFDDTPVIERLPKESFYRLIAFEILPKEVERCIYLDPDTYILRSLKPLYDMDMGDNIIAAGSHTYSYIEKLNHVRLKMGKHSKYINSGVMVMDLVKMREYTTVKKVMEYVSANIQKLYLGDQDAMNGIFWEKTMDIDIKLYNMDEKTLKRYKLDVSWVRDNTVIVHYNGKYKPWNEGYKGELDVFYPPVENKGPAPKGKTKRQIKAYMNIIKLNRQQKIILSVGALFWIACIICYAVFGAEIKQYLQIAIENPERFRALLDSTHGLDRLIFVLIRAIQTAIKIIPAEPLEIGSGYAFGTFGGLLYCLIGNVIGSIALLVLTKKFGRKLVDVFIPSSKIDEMRICKDPSKVYILLFILYLIPGTPKDGFTYLVGLTKLNFVWFMVLTTFARIPSIISSTWCGATLSEQNYWLSAAIFIGTFILGVGGGLIYNKCFNKKKDKE